MIDLSNRVALVTGGSRGIGAATALLLAQAGADVVITFSSDRRRAADIQSMIHAMGRRCGIQKADVASASDIRKTVRSVLSRFKRIDILVNNAGIWKSGSIGRMTPRQWDETLDVNLRGTFLFCNAVAPWMKKHGGKIINVSSTAGQRGEAFYSHYAASKAGVIAFTKSVAVELAPYGVNVNCVAPGWVDTDMTAAALGAPRSRKQIEAGIPRGRVAAPEEIAGPILFLASPLSDHVVGATLNVNGGGVLSG